MDYVPLLFIVRRPEVYVKLKFDHSKYKKVAILVAVTVSLIVEMTLHCGNMLSRLMPVIMVVEFPVLPPPIQIPIHV